MKLRSMGSGMLLLDMICAHGYFHRDILLPDGSQDKIALPFEELSSALSYAEQDLKDNWENYRKNYLRRYDK